MNPVVCGTIQRTPIPVLADKAARAVMQYAGPRAVTIEPGGKVLVEAPQDAAEFDLVGCYTRSLGLLDLSRALIEDLRHEVQSRRKGGPTCA